ncbi:unnamed protein product [Durusdinium trenchii]|uniref:Uncharacterized protein n=1 Tax=Durusdinium trenchii TaxID=1381693 RepID=A0ABP0KDW7_9DINO
MEPESACPPEPWEAVQTSSSLQSRSSKTSSSSVLSFELEPELLRGVPLDVALAGWCKHWQNDQDATGPSVDEVSQEVDSIDAFLSHDWQTSRWLKLATLLMVFNSRAATVVSLLTSLLVGVLRVCDYLPDELWTTSIPCLAYLVVFCFWQRMRSVCRRPLIVFLDRLCIHQQDQELKQKGILGLGAFVVRSKRLVALWSPRYFSRLWCTYEIGCFLRRMDQARIEILPVKTAYLLILVSILWHTLMISFYLFSGYVREIEPDERVNQLIYTSAAMPVLASVLLPVVNYLGMGIMQDVDQLSRQLQSFRVKDAQCYCCSNNHRDPLTGDELLCDRQLVYDTLGVMYSRDLRATPGDMEDLALEYFDSCVQGVLGQKVVGRLGGDLPLRYLICVVGVSNLPFLSELISRLKKGPSVPLLGLDFAIWFAVQILHWAHPVLAIFLSAQVSQKLWKLFHYKSSVFSAIWMSPIIVIAVTCAWVPFEVVSHLTPENSMLAFLPFLAIVVLDACLYWKPSRTLQKSNPPTNDAGSVLDKNHQDSSRSLSTLETYARTWEVEEKDDTLVVWKF